MIDINAGKKIDNIDPISNKIIKANTDINMSVIPYHTCV